MAIREGVKQTASQMEQIIDDAVNSTARHILDEIKLEEYANIAKLSATNAVMHSKMVNINKRIVEIIQDETNKASEAFNSVFAEAVVEALEEITGQRINLA